MQELCRLLALVFVATFTPLNWAQTVTAVTPLAFGSFAPGTGTGTVTLSATGVRSKTGAVRLVSSGPGSAASFTLTGKGKQKNYIARDPSATCTTMSAGGGRQMNVRNFTSSPVAFGVKGSLDGNKMATLTVGGTVDVANSQPRGLYECSFDLIVDFYN